MYSQLEEQVIDINLLLPGASGGTGAIRQLFTLPLTNQEIPRDQRAAELAADFNHLKRLREALALCAENWRQRHNTFGGISTKQNGKTRQPKLQNKVLVTAAFKSSTLGTLGISNHPKVPSN